MAQVRNWESSLTTKLLVTAHSCPAEAALPPNRNTSFMRLGRDLAGANTVIIRARILT